jgi:hypothetical protein
VGKQPRRPAAGSEEERHRALIRELHEHAKAAREAERDLRTATAEADRSRARLEETADGIIEAAALAVHAQFDIARTDAERLAGEFNARFRETVAELCGLPSGEALVDRVIEGIAGIIRPIVDQATGRALEHRLNQVLPVPGQEKDKVTVRRARPPT